MGQTDPCCGAKTRRDAFSSLSGLGACCLLLSSPRVRCHLWTMHLPCRQYRHRRLLLVSEVLSVLVRRQQFNPPRLALLRVPAAAECYGEVD
jgi:hypothetical protein